MKNKKTMTKEDYALELYNIVHEIKVYLFSIKELNEYFNKEDRNNLPQDLNIDISHFNNWHMSNVSGNHNEYDNLTHNRRMTKHHLITACKLLNNDLKEYISLNLVLTRIKMSYKMRIKK